MAAVVQTQSLASQLLAAIGAPTTTPNIAAMTAWLNSESTHTASTITAVGNNPLNISTGADVSGKVIGTTRVGPGIAQYASVPVGVQATAQYLAARQPGIIAGFKTGTGTPAVTAITASNYVTGGSCGNQYGGNLLGRYQEVLSTLVSASGTTAPSGGASTPLTSTPSQTNPGSVTTDTLGKLGINTDPTHVLTESDIWKIAMAATQQDTTTPINANNQIYQGYLANLKGKTVAQMASDYAAGVTYQPPGLTFPDITGAVMFIGVIAVGAVLILTGGIITLKRK